MKFSKILISVAVETMILQGVRGEQQHLIVDTPPTGILNNPNPQRDPHGPECQVGSWYTGPLPGSYYTGRVCQLGLFQNINYGGGQPWTGFPLGLDYGNGTPYPIFGLNNQCWNLGDITDDIDLATSSYKASGWCECSFFSVPGCNPNSFRFSAFNRADSRLDEHGPDNDQIRSFRCQYMRHEELFNNGTILWGGPEGKFDWLSSKNETSPDAFSAAGWRRAWKRITFTPDMMDKCQPALETNAYARKVVINGMTCRFFTNPTCSGDEVIVGGNTGRVEWNYKDQPVWCADIKSYSCSYPAGIQNQDRSDIGDPDMPDPRDVN
ncbi:hypothetical protein AA313_de0201402 [Arthrobotrys entomopaga]|nr:hypothetical protein AA313_de0201402 [Arthrobotrys entomopaga]